MTDTEIVDWIEVNITKIYESFSGRMAITWLDKRGIKQSIEGNDLRDCVLKAVTNDKSSE